MKKSKKQILYINIDDSGKISAKEQYAIYGGVLFFSKKEKDKFITQYRSIVDSVKCKYCPLNNSNCDNKCPELKHSNLRNNDLRRMRNYIKKYFVFACTIDNSKIYQHIISDKASKGRFLDYTLRRLIKGIMVKLVNENKINSQKDLKIILNIDEQATKSNGYYNLKEGLLEELKYGILNYNYATRYTPIIKGNLIIQLIYQKSDRCFGVQAADLIAGTTRKINIMFNKYEKKINNKLRYLDYVIFLP